jgi:hypothetical protein
MMIKVAKSIEVKHEGTLTVLYVDGKAIEAYLMHEFEERARLLSKAKHVLEGMHKNECRNRRVFGLAHVTYESFVRGFAGPNVRDYVLFDGSKTHVILWPDQKYKSLIL